MQLVALAGDLGPKWFHVAIRALVLLAKTPDIMTSNQIAEKLGSESTYMRKIMVRLSRSNLVVSYPGRYGGYALKRPAGEISVLDIYLALVDTAPVINPYYVLSLLSIS